MWAYDNRPTCKFLLTLLLIYFFLRIFFLFFLLFPFGTHHNCWRHISESNFLSSSSSSFIPPSVVVTCWVNQRKSASVTCNSIRLFAAHSFYYFSIQVNSWRTSRHNLKGKRQLLLLSSLSCKELSTDSLEVTMSSMFRCSEILWSLSIFNSLFRS